MSKKLLKSKKLVKINELENILKLSISKLSEINIVNEN